MLKELRILNIVLIESATVQFSPGFNVLSGESGAGKSAIMHALGLIAGVRCDSTVVRRGADKGVVEAIFEIDHLPQLSSLLENCGIDHEPGSELFIRREISVSGKSRAFINNQLAQLALLRQVTAALFEIVGQHANQQLLSLDYHRLVIDLHGDLQAARAAFAACWEEEKAAARKLEELTHSEAERQRDIERCQQIIEELTEADIKEGEEEQLFAAYSRLSNADALLAKVGEINRVLTGEKMAALTLLNRQKSAFEQLLQIAPDLAEASAAYASALLELAEVAHVLQRFESQIECNPHKAAVLNQRLELINQIKRKYNLASEEISPFLQASQNRLHALENCESEIEELKATLHNLTTKSSHLARILTEKRKHTSNQFQKQMEIQLRSLNMPKAQFLAEITPQKRTTSGDDKIEFFLTPNVGEHQIAVKECASGGELSRMILAIHTLLGGKGGIPTLIFDEIDGNIGGETASVVGQKLLEIAQNHQVLCITHFHQVAIQAPHHLRVHKTEINGRTLSHIDLLTPSTRHVELARMLGDSVP